MPDLARVLVLAPNWLGDAVMALPAVADLRRAYPAARIAVAARRAVAGLFTMVPGIDEVIDLEAKGGWRRLARRAGDRERLAQSAADAALLLPNSFASAWLVARAGVAERWGYATDWRSALLTRAVPRPRTSLHQGVYYQTLTRSLGMQSGPLEPQLEVPDASRAAARSLLTSAGWDGVSPFVVFAPGAAYGTAKRWLPSYVAQVAGALVADHRLTCVLIGGPGDAATARQVIRLVPPAARAQVLELTGRTSLETMAAVLALARVSISNDSGAMHVAAAVGTPVVAIFGPTREYETAPLTRSGGQATVLMNPVWCRPCMLRECPIDHRCMQGLPPARVQHAVEKHL